MKDTLFGPDVGWHWSQKFNERDEYIYPYFRDLALMMWKKGRGQWSAHGVCYALRYRQEIERGLDGFKINHGKSKYYAQRFLEDHPEAEGFFRFKHQVDKSELREKIQASR